MKKKKIEPINLSRNVFGVFEKVSFKKALVPYQKNKFTNKPDTISFIEFLINWAELDTNFKRGMNLIFETYDDKVDFFFDNLRDVDKYSDDEKEKFIENERKQNGSEFSKFWYDVPNMLYLRRFLVLLVSFNCFDVDGTSLHLNDEMSNLLESIYIYP